jgi:SMODS and SLOG-associating 2TM effector domain 1/Protein of unknown function (DUF4231)
MGSGPAEPPAASAPTANGKNPDSSRGDVAHRLRSPSRSDVQRYGLVTAPELPAVEWAWRRQSTWSQTADNLKAGPNRQWRLRLALTVVAAALALAGSQIKAVSLPASIALAVTAALALAAVGLLRGRQNVEQARPWTRARSVSEAIKTEVFLYLTKSGSYDGPDHDQRLEAEVQRLEHEAGDLQRYTHGVQPRERPLPAVHDVDSYLDVRVRQSQLEGYYEPKADLLRQRLQVLKAVEVTLALAAGGLAAVAAVAPGVAAWAAVVTTAAGATAAYVASQRYEFLWIEYSRTASELRRLLDRRTAADGRPLSGPELVAECEQVISVQNQAWMAKWGEENASTAGLPLHGRLTATQRAGGRKCRLAHMVDMPVSGHSSR